MTESVGGTALHGLPAVDEITARRVLFVTDRRTVTLSPAVGQFLATAEIEQVRPVLMTGVEARLSPFVNWEMLRLGGSWVLRTDDGTLVDALAGRPLESLDELNFPRAVRQRQPLPMRDHTTTEPIAVMTVELITAHQPTTDLIVGESPTSVLDALALRDLDAWGYSEPLTSVWDRAELTRHARMQMPLTPFIRASSPDGARATLRFENNSNALLERVNMMIPLEPYAEAAPGFDERAADVLEELADRHAVVSGTISLIDGDAGGHMHIRRRRPEVPQALLIGAWGLREAGVDLDAVRQLPGIRAVGGQWSASLLARFDSANGTPWQQFHALVHTAGLAGTLRTFGLDGVIRVDS